MSFFFLWRLQQHSWWMWEIAHLFFFFFPSIFFFSYIFSLFLHCPSSASLNKHTRLSRSNWDRHWCALLCSVFPSKRFLWCLYTLLWMATRVYSMLNNPHTAHRIAVYYILASIGHISMCACILFCSEYFNYLLGADDAAAVWLLAGIIWN